MNLSHHNRRAAAVVQRVGEIVQTERGEGNHLHKGRTMTNKKEVGGMSGLACLRLPLSG